MSGSKADLDLRLRSQILTWRFGGPKEEPSEGLMTACLLEAPLAVTQLVEGDASLSLEFLVENEDTCWSTFVSAP